MPQTRRQCLAVLGSTAVFPFLKWSVRAAAEEPPGGGSVFEFPFAPPESQGPFNPFEVPPGQRAFGYLSVVNSLAARIDIPVGVINGAAGGATFTVTGGLFPTEHDGVEAACELYQLLQPAQLTGRVVIVPVVNMPCLQFRTPMFNLTQSTSPMDGLNINSVFPGSADGTVTRVVAHTLFQEIILKSNYHIDLRGGDLNESHLVHTIYPRIGKEIDATCEKMAEAVGFEYVLPGTPEISHTGKGTLVFETVTRGIPSMITESGLGYRTQPLPQFVKGHVDGVVNVLKVLGFMKGEVAKPKQQRFLDMKWERVRTPATGFFHAIADQGDLLKQGQLIGRITGIDGSEVAKIVSPIDGVVHTMFPRRLVYAGDGLYTLLRIAGPTGWVPTSTT